MADCYDCHAPYGSWPDFYVEPEVWAAHSPSGDEGGLLCLNCLAQRMANRADGREERGETDTRINPVLAAKITGSAPRSIRPGDTVDGENRAGGRVMFVGDDRAFVRWPKTDRQSLHETATLLSHLRLATPTKDTPQ